LPKSHIFGEVHGFLDQRLHSDVRFRPVASLCPILSGTAKCGHSLPAPGAVTDDHGADVPQEYSSLPDRLQMAANDHMLNTLDQQLQ
jgi:hypothetical protein